MSNAPILYIDFYHTLSDDNFWRNCSDDIKSAATEHIFSDYDMVCDWMRGKYTSEDMNRRLAEKTGVTYGSLWDAFINDCRSLYVNTNLLTHIRQLQNRYKTVLITDNMDSFSRFTWPDLKQAGAFDEMVNSADYGLLKSDNNGKLFEITAPGNNKNHILIDDSKQNCELFNNRYGRSVQTTGPDDTLQILKELLLQES